MLKKEKVIISKSFFVTSLEKRGKCIKALPGILGGNPGIQAG
jgi:hypothetical protein